MKQGNVLRVNVPITTSEDAASYVLSANVCLTTNGVEAIVRVVSECLCRNECRWSKYTCCD
jgi:hypothetical protein